MFDENSKPWALGSVGGPALTPPSPSQEAFEWVPAHGNRKGLWSELLPAIIDTLPHMWSDDLMQQSVRVYEDRKSGRHLYELIKRRRVVATPQLLADAMDVVVLWAEQRLEPPAVARLKPMLMLALTLTTHHHWLQSTARLPPPTNHRHDEMPRRLLHPGWARVHR